MNSLLNQFGGEPAGPGQGGLIPAAPWQRGLLALVAVLILGLIASFDPAFLKQNLASAGEFFLSPHFLFFCLAGAFLAVPKVTGRWYEASAFLLAVLYLFLFYGDYLLLVHMSGDSICQVAYWNLLFRRNLVGSIGVAFAKPGQVLILGLLYQLSLIGGHIVFKVGLCLIMAACVWSLVGVARDVGGRLAGILAFFLSLWAFQVDFVFSGSAIYAIATLFAGLRFYYFYPRHKGLGRLLLVLALQFRIEAVAVLAVVWLLTLYRKEWRELWVLSAWSLVSLLAFVGLILQIQGSLARLNSGAAVGYVGPVLSNGTIDPAVSGNKFTYMADILRDDFSHRYYIRFLFILALAGVAGACSFGGQPYLAVFASLVVVVVNVLLLGGTFNLERYCDLIYAFGCAIGGGTLVRGAGLVWQRRSALPWAGLVVTIVALAAVFDFGRLNLYKKLDPASTSEAFTSAMSLLQDGNLADTTRLMSEDDLLAHVVVVAPDRFDQLTALQYFNVANDEERQRILARTDYIWFDLNGFPYYYLFHLPVAAWQSDPFRLMVQAILADRQQPRTLYGYRFTPVDIDFSHLLLRVEH